MATRKKMPVKRQSKGMIGIFDPLGLNLSKALGMSGTSKKKKTAKPKRSAYLTAKKRAQLEELNSQYYTQRNYFGRTAKARQLDKMRSAKKVGWRMSAKTGKLYLERRSNRSDRESNFV